MRLSFALKHPARLKSRSNNTVLLVFCILNDYNNIIIIIIKQFLILLHRPGILLVVPRSMTAELNSFASQLTCTLAKQPETLLARAS